MLIPSRLDTIVLSESQNVIYLVHLKQIHKKIQKCKREQEYNEGTEQIEQPSTLNAKYKIM